ncbi:MAG: sulfate adenylyltransferase subunit CysD [Saprospiraceae bacterium]|nr:sulfate adenylyltransferase subunit CysD [Saprospiraceae bacterium]
MTKKRPMKQSLSHLDRLESEAIYILRETAGQFDRPALMFSGGKDSITLVHLALKAFRPGPIPFPLLHIDTGHNFRETLDFRDQLAAQTGARLITRHVEDSIRQGKAIDPKGKNASRNALQSITLLDAIEEFRFDACIGGARRDEEKARAKERVFSVRNEFGEWDPKRQRPELWNIFNGKVHPGENVRVFPISNWTEMDVWQYIRRENMALPSLYFSHRRDVVHRNGAWMAADPCLNMDEQDTVHSKIIRFRTIGDITCTAAVESDARTVEDILTELRNTKFSERGARLDDRLSEAAMEERKKAGYF